MDGRKVTLEFYMTGTRATIPACSRQYHGGPPKEIHETEIRSSGKIQGKLFIKGRS